MGEQLKGKVYALQVATGDIQVTGCRCACGDDDSIVTGKTVDKRLAGHLLAVTELDALLLKQSQTTIDDRLVELEVRDAVAEKTAGGFSFFKDRDLITHVVQIVGGSKTGRPCSYHGHLLTIAKGMMNTDVALTESRLGDGTLVFTVGGRLMLNQVQHACLLAEGRTDTSGELWERVCGVEQTVGQFPVAFI